MSSRTYNFMNMKKRFPINLEDFKEIESMGRYSVKQLSPWHFRVRKVEDETVLDIFPTTRKYIIKHGDFFSKSKSYENLIDTVEILLK